MKKQAGFTLIELIVVIVILGVLSAIALPKFLSIANDARASVMRGVQGSMSGANSMIYGKAAINGLLGAGPSTLSAAQTGSLTVAVVWGYAQNATQLQRAMDINVTGTGDFQIVGNTIQHRKAINPAACLITYTPATSATVPPLYTPTLTGC